MCQINIEMGCDIATLTIKWLISDRYFIPVSCFKTVSILIVSFIRNDVINKNGVLRFLTGGTLIISNISAYRGSE